jgi:hypothetical protein
MYPSRFDCSLRGGDLLLLLALILLSLGCATKRTPPEFPDQDATTNEITGLAAVQFAVHPFASPTRLSLTQLLRFGHSSPVIAATRPPQVETKQGSQ